MLRPFTLLLLASLVALSALAHQEGIPTRHYRHQANSGPSPSPSHGGKKPVKKDIIPITEALGARTDLARCPQGSMACPIMAAGGLTDEYECIEADTELTSCGGCASLTTGQDCTVIPNALSMTCQVGRCQVYTCEAGYIPNEAETGCVRGFATDNVLQARRLKRSRKH